MIIIRLAGGLGNQIFQLGACLLLADRSGIKKIIIDDSALSKYETKRENELTKIFDFSRLDIETEFRGVFITKLRLPKLIPLSFSKYPFVSDKNFQTILKNPNKVFMWMDGYFQRTLSQQDFDKEVELLKSIYTHNNLRNNDGCIIHIRGGDFLKLGWHLITPKEYYMKAKEIMRNRYNQNKFYIVTDDKPYARTILDDLDIEYEFIGNSIHEDFKLIGSFNYRIISASTFALFASALGYNQNSIVIAPSYWSPNFERKIYLPNEIRIEGV